MNLIYKIKTFQPRIEFQGKGFPQDFGNFSKFEIPVKFQGINLKYAFLFDTGAYISYAPQSILELLEIEPNFEGDVYGISAEYKIQTKIAKINFNISDDEGNESPTISSWFAFYPFDSGPRLLGMKTALESVGFLKEYNGEQLILSFPD
jgi:hypothetical protein